MKKPVAFIIFNRPDTTQRVFNEIRKYAPEQLFVIADGPRKDKLNELQLCQQTRDVIKVDWDCNVRYIYSNENLGCQKRIYTGLNEVFDNVEEAIILEDDCVPHESFFKYCEELLDYYKDNEQIMAISGNNFQPEGFSIEESYYFSIFPHCWGWATWRRAWSKMDIKMEKWPDYKQSLEFNKLCYDTFFRDYWVKIFDEVREGKIDTWDYPWTFSCWINNGLTVLPKKNLVSNIGFDERATHTVDPNSPFANLPVYEMKFPLKHPSIIESNFFCDFYTSENHYGIKELKKLTNINSEKFDFLIKYLSNNLKVDTLFNKEIYIFGNAEWSVLIGKILQELGFYINKYIVSHKTIEDDEIISLSELPDKEKVLIILGIEGYHYKLIAEKIRDEKEKVEVISWRDF